MDGKFITFEGPDGSGKGTIIKYIVKYLKRKNLSFIVTREPGGIDISEQIRNIILDNKNTAMDKRTEALLYAAARRQHLVQKVIPALKEGKIVICDRFIDSSLAYQGEARGIGIKDVFKMNKFAIEDIMPDLTLYLDVPAKVGLNRIVKSEVRKKDRLDLESLNFHKKVNLGYKKVIEKYPERFVVIDATQSIRRVSDLSVNALHEYLKASNFL